MSMYECVCVCEHVPMWDAISKIFLFSFVTFLSSQLKCFKRSESKEYKIKIVYLTRMKIIFDNLLNNFLPCDAYWKYIEILNNKKGTESQT